MGKETKGLDSFTGVEFARPFTYSQEEIQWLFDKIKNGHLLTKSEYEQIKDLDLSKFSTFSGDYDDLIDKPDISSIVLNVIAEQGISNREELDSKLSQITTTFNERCSELNESIRTDMTEEIAAIYDILGEGPPSTEGNYGDRISALEEANEQLESDLAAVLNMLEKPPTYSAPSVSLSISPSSTIHNEATAITITPKFNKNDAGDIVSYILKKGNDVVAEGTILESYKDTVTLQHGGNNASYSVTVSYGDGPIKNTNTGRPYPSTAIKAGSVSGTASIRAWAYSYYGVIDTDTVSEADIANLNKVILHSRNNTVTYNLQEGQRSVYLYPSNFGSLSSIKDSNNFDYINSYTVSTITYNDIVYNVYVLTDPVEISGFKQIFN